MRAIARIRFKGGVLMLPSRTPYDLETVLENLEWYAARDRTVQLELDGHHWWVDHGGVPNDGGCGQCRGARAAFTFVNGIHVRVCRRCARAGLASRFAEWPRPEPPRVAVDQE